MGGRYFEGNDINEREIIGGSMTIDIGITLRFSYPWNDEGEDESTIRSCLLDLSANELLAAAIKFGEPIDIDIEVNR